MYGSEMPLSLTSYDASVIREWRTSRHCVKRMIASRCIHAYTSPKCEYYQERDPRTMPAGNVVIYMNESQTRIPPVASKSAPQSRCWPRLLDRKGG